MAFPFPGFGSNLFAIDEMPLDESDSLWKRSPKRDRNANLGATRDSIVTLAIGSSQRSFEMYLEPDRYTFWDSLIGSTQLLCDWTAPVPDLRNAYLELVEPLQQVAVLCSDGYTHRKIRTKFTFVSQ